MKTLLDAVLIQVEKDVLSGDMTAIEELLANVPAKHLISFLPEEMKEWAETKAVGRFITSEPPAIAR